LYEFGFAAVSMVESVEGVVIIRGLDRSRVA
jgi:hypothetical protein